MSVGLLLITHHRIGAELLEVATRIYGGCPLAVAAIDVDESDDPQWLRAEAERCLARIDGGGGVLVLTDLYGSTPANIASALAGRTTVRVLSGVSLPMLVRVLNYAGLELTALTDKAMSGGRDGVLECPAPSR